MQHFLQTLGHNNKCLMCNWHYYYYFYSTCPQALGLNCPVRQKEQQNKQHNMHIVMSILSINPIGSNFKLCAMHSVCGVKMVRTLCGVVIARKAKMT